MPTSAELLTAFDPADADGWMWVTDRMATLCRVPGMEGYRIMEILRDFGFDIAATCGGAATCGTCHIRLMSQADYDRLPAMQAEEITQLDTLAAAGPLSRLACQILWNKARMDGLKLALAPPE